MRRGGAGVDRGDTEVVGGIVTRVLWDSEESGRCLLEVEVETPRGLERSKAEGPLRGFSSGDFVRFEGEWREGTFRGVPDRKFAAVRARLDLPATEDGALRFLAGVFGEVRHGIARVAIERLVRVRGPSALAAAVEDPSVLVALSSSPDRHRPAILADWRRRTSTRRAALLLEGAGWNAEAVDSVLRAFAETAFDRLSDNPYVAVPFKDVGFEGADALARRIGIGPGDSRRVSAAVEEALRETEASGSAYTPMEDFAAAVSRRTGLPHEAVSEHLRAAAGAAHMIYAAPDRSGDTVPCVGRASTSRREAEIARDVSALLSRGGGVSDPVAVEAVAARVFAKDGPFARFDPVQRTAAIMAATEPFSIITGGPGTGKSTVMEAFVALEAAMGRSVLRLTAPTGKAAKRLSETTRLEARTLQSLLGQQPPALPGGANTFRLHAANPLPRGVTVVVDEASMVDSELMAALLRAVPSDGRIVLVGDRNQLPSVGCGNVLADLLHARTGDRRAIPSVGLVNVYRQGRDSGIAIGATAVRDGRVPDLDVLREKGVRFDDVAENDIALAVERLVCEELPARGLDPIRDVALLVPQHAGAVGTREMNRRLSLRLNQRGEAIPGVRASARGDEPAPRVGDRVMIRENSRLVNVATGLPITVVNGDLGIVEGVRAGAEGRAGSAEILVRRDDGDLVALPARAWRSIPLAYALTVHKSQGSQYRAVVMPFSEAHAEMMDRTLVYTGWTRAQENLHMLGSRAVLERGVATWRGKDRLTVLGHCISSRPPADFASPSGRDWELAGLEAARAAEVGRPARLAAAPGLPEPRPPRPVSQFASLPKALPSFMRPRPPVAESPPGGEAAPPDVPSGVPSPSGTRHEPAFLRRRREAMTGSLGRSLPHPPPPSPQPAR